MHNNILQFHNPFSCHFHQILTRKLVSLLLLITFFTFIFIVKHLSKHPFYSLSQQIPVYCCCFLFICCVSIINKKTHYIWHLNTKSHTLGYLFPQLLSCYYILILHLSHLHNQQSPLSCWYTTFIPNPYSINRHIPSTLLFIILSPLALFHSHPLDRLPQSIQRTLLFSPLSTSIQPFILLASFT